MTIKTNLSNELRNDARSWVADCLWADLDDADIANLSDATLVRGIERHYEGGWAQFVADGQ